jgi:hypothetical protein
VQGNKSGDPRRLFKPHIPKTAPIRKEYGGYGAVNPALTIETLRKWVLYAISDVSGSTGLCIYFDWVCQGYELVVLGASVASPFGR